MDFLKWKTRIVESVGKYKYVWVVLLIGMALMMIPGKEDKRTKTDPIQPIQQCTETDLSAQLEEILGQVNGAGQVRVMLSVAKGECTIYQTDSSYTQNDTHTDTQTQTVLITDSGRNEMGLIHQKNPPTYQGAIVLAQGADDPVVKLSIVEAVSDVTGLGANKISVLKMQ